MTTKRFPSLFTPREQRDGNVLPLDCRAAKPGTFRERQCSNPGKFEFTQGALDAMDDKIIRYGYGNSSRDGLTKLVGHKFCGNHSPVKIYSGLEAEFLAERAEQEAYQAKRNTVESRVDGLTQRIHDLGIESRYPVRPHRTSLGYGKSELSSTTAEVEFSLLETLLDRIHDLESALRSK